MEERTMRGREWQGLGEPADLEGQGAKAGPRTLFWPQSETAESHWKILQNTDPCAEVQELLAGGQMAGERR